MKKTNVTNLQGLIPSRQPAPAMVPYWKESNFLQ